ncbi:MAG TPA: hypothetical protein QF753_20125 [Victivallales bacterium]|nr:hypothetical protein [Victivallales bacterium]
MKNEQKEKNRTKKEHRQKCRKKAVALILAYLKNCGLPYWTDITDAHGSFARIDNSLGRKIVHLINDKKNKRFTIKFFNNTDFKKLMDTQHVSYSMKKDKNN